MATDRTVYVDVVGGDHPVPDSQFVFIDDWYTIYSESQVSP